ncbi:EF-hand calcium-binding domain-containing protein 4A [Mantella aurantiaca]
MEHRGTPPRCSPCLKGRKGYKVPVMSSISPLDRDSEEMMRKAKELFQLCDKEMKGTITKRDLQMQQNELPLTPEQLDVVFDSLDQNNHGYLTPVEFSLGLGKLLGVNMANGEEEERPLMEETYESGWSEEDQDDADERLFYTTMEQLGAARIFQEHGELRDLWTRLRNEHPELLTNFEEFLFRVSSHIRDVHNEKETLEEVLKRKEIAHEERVNHLFAEMEQQIKGQRKKPTEEKISPTHQDRQTTVQTELMWKEQEFDALVLRHRQLEHKLQSLNSKQFETRVQNDRLKQLNEELIEQLEGTKTDLEKAQESLLKLRKQEQEEQDRKKREAYKVSQNMQKEKRSLLRQLELLRDINKKLRDEKDVIVAKKLDTLKKNPTEPMMAPSCCCCCCSSYAGSVRCDPSL